MHGWQELATSSRRVSTGKHRRHGLGLAQQQSVSTRLLLFEYPLFTVFVAVRYFVDGARAKIEVIRIDINNTGRMRRTILNETVLDKPRGITVHPVRGYMFYTDWSSEKPCVCRANLDGTSQVRRSVQLLVDIAYHSRSAGEVDHITHRTVA